MNNISVRAKFMIIAVVVFLIGVSLVYIQAKQVNDLRIQRDVEELAGTKVLLPAYKLQVALLTKKVQLESGQSTEKSDGEIASHKDAVKAADAQFKKVLVTTTDLEKANADPWAKVDGLLGSTGTPAEIDAAVAELFVYQTYVGDISDLILDPELDTYYLMSALVVGLPKLATSVADVHSASHTGGFPKPADRDAFLDKKTRAEVFDADVDGYITSADGFAEAAKQEMSVKATVTAVGPLKAQITELLSAGLAGSSNRSTLTATSLARCQETYEQVTKVMEQYLVKRIAQNEGVLKYIWLVAALGFFLVAAFVFWVVSDITKNLQLAVDSAREFGDGDLRRQLDTSRTDELGNLLTSLETMRRNFKNQIGSIASASGTNRVSAQQIQATASQVAATSTEMATSIAEASATVEEVRQTALLSEQKAKTMANSAQDAAKVAAQGTQMVAATTQEMEGLRTTMESIAESILQLSNQSQAISNIITTVSDLAEQSNVLAVNASIEAAKAGEFGRGFAVVAQEVKGLADESKQATLQVRSILQEIERATAASVMIAEQGSKAAQTALKQASEAGSSIRDLGTKVVQSAQAAAQISMSSAQQLSGMEQVVEAMLAIKESSAQVLPSMTELSNSATSLSNVAETLSKSVEQFKS